MIAKQLSRLRLPVSTFLLALACVACNGSGNSAPAPPATGEPAPIAAVTPAEDRGKEQPAADATTTSDESAFSHVEGAEAERAASKRGHESAGETAPAGEARSGG
jgi:hypothetical protein